ncbi:MAG TPA: hypothetical protein DCE41_13930 [Cytophagales bacterium]|nr:hypothetical protein [Cytophagales bacterium]HAA21669.1 hypothetical protein [Cytophagales bacterium]
MASILPNKLPQALVWLLLLVVAGATQWAALCQTPYANGWDGYYYVMQAHSWLTYGHLHSADFSLIYPLVTGVSALVGDGVLGFKITNVLLAMGLVSAVYGLVRAHSQEVVLAALASALVVASPTLTYFVVQFPKNTLGLIFLLGFLWQARSARWLGATLFLLLAFFTHRMAAGLGLLVLGGLILQRLPFRWLLVLGVVFLAASFLPGLLSWQDLARFRGEFQIPPQWAPESFRKVFGASLSGWWQGELYLLSGALVWGLLAWGFRVYRRDLDPFMGWVAPLFIILAAFPWFHFYQGSMGYRFFLTLPLWLSVFAVSSFQKRKWTVWQVLVLLVISGWSWRSYRPADHDPPYAQFERMVETIQQHHSPERYPLVIAHKGLAELIIYQTDFNALNWSPPPSVDTDSVLRIVHGLEPYHLDRVLGPGKLEGVVALGPRYYLAPEPFWHQFREKAMRAGDEALLRRLRSARNPWQPRPDYLTKGKE